MDAVSSASLFALIRASYNLLQIVPMKYNPRDENSIKAVMAKANVVINLIGIQSSSIIFPISNIV